MAYGLVCMLIFSPYAICISNQIKWNFAGSFTAATDINTIKQRSITYILTLDICPLPVRVTELPFLKTKYVHGNNNNNQIIN